MPADGRLRYPATNLQIFSQLIAVIDPANHAQDPENQSAALCVNIDQEDVRHPTLFIIASLKNVSVEIYGDNERLI